MRKVAFIKSVRVGRFPRKLIHAAIENRSVQVLQIEAAFAKVLRQPVEQLRIRWRISKIEIVRCVDDADSEILRPDPIHDGRREVGVVGLPHPLPELNSRIGAAFLLAEDFASQNLRRDFPDGAFISSLNARLDVFVTVSARQALLFLAGFRIAETSEREDRFETLEVFLSPTIEWMVMALSTF